MWILKYKYIKKFSNLFASVAVWVQRNTSSLPVFLPSHPNKLAQVNKNYIMLK